MIWLGVLICAVAVLLLGIMSLAGYLRSEMERGPGIGWNDHE